MVKETNIPPVVNDKGNKDVPSKTKPKPKKKVLTPLMKAEIRGEAIRKAKLTITKKRKEFSDLILEEIQKNEPDWDKILEHNAMLDKMTKVKSVISIKLME